MSAFSEVEIKVFGSKETYATLDAQDESRVADLIRTEVLPRTDAEYYKVNVKVKRASDQTPQYLIAYLLRKDIYRAEVVKVVIDADYQLRQVTFDYDASADEADEDEGEEGEAEPESETFGGADGETYVLDFIVATPVPDIPTAKQAVEAIHSLALSLGLRSRMLLGPDASVANYKKYLAAGVAGFVNIGHGNPSCIVLSDGTLTATWFSGLANKPLRPATVYFNSCQVFNDPLKAAVMKAGARTFIGGVVNLLIGPSEKVCACFWTKVLRSPTTMQAALTTCEKELYPNEGCHGIIGDLGLFDPVFIKLTHAMWAHGHEVQIEAPERLTMVQRIGSCLHIQGKPFTGNWLHLAVPTPVIVDGARHCVGSVLMRFHTGPGTTIDAVHIYDGERLIDPHNGLGLSAKAGYATVRFDVPTHPSINWGLGVSIGVKFGDGANLPPDKLTLDLSSVGCDFVQKS